MPCKLSRVPLFGLVGLAGFAAVGLAVDATLPTAEAGPPPHAAAKNGPPGLAKNRFLGAHPLVGSPATGYCYIDVPHVHDYVPDRPAVFKEVGDEYVFTGDPVPFGYEGDKTVFYGHHPVPVPIEVTATAAPPTFCFIKGPHYHDYSQPEAPGFKQKDSAVFYVGPIPPEVAQERPQAERAVEAEYQPYVALRPQIKVTPPPEWQGAVWVPPPSQAVVVAAPQPVVVAPPQPQLVVAPPQPVFVAPPQPQLVVAPPQPVFVAPPQPQVVVAAPQPRVVVAAPAPSVVVTAPHPSVVVVPPHPPSIVIGAPAPPGVIFYGGPGYGPGHGPGRGHAYGHWKGGHGGWKGGGHWKGGRH